MLKLLLVYCTLIEFGRDFKRRRAIAKKRATSNGYGSDLRVVCPKILEMSGFNKGLVTSYRKVTEIGA